MEYYFNSPLELPALAAQLSAELGCDLRPYKGDEEEYYDRFVGMEFSLEPNDFENDGELSWLRCCASCACCTTASKYGGILVHDLDVLLARYEAPTFVDTLSGTSMDDFAAHLTVLTARIP